MLSAIYVDDIIVELKSSQEGCSIGGLYLGCVMYADDLLLLSASLRYNITKNDKHMCICCRSFRYHLQCQKINGSQGWTCL